MIDFSRMRVALKRIGIVMLVAAATCATPAMAQQPSALPPPRTAVQTLCSMLCGGTWRVKLPPAQAANMRVSYTYQLDSLRVMVVGKGYFRPNKGTAWFDMHYYMADPDGSKLRYMGISPKAGMTTGTVKLLPDGFTTIVNQLNIAQLFARIANKFPDSKTHVMTLYQSEDGFEKPSAIIQLTR